MAVLVVGLGGRASLAQAAPVAAPQVVGCGGSSAPVEAETETETPDGAGEAPDPSDDPYAAEPGDARIVGSVKAPPGLNEDDQKALTPLASISKAQALAAAQALIPDMDQRKVQKAALEIDQGFVIWSIKTVRRAPGPSSDLSYEVKVKVDAGTGEALLVECEGQGG